MGVGAPARNSRHDWQSRFCGPSDRNSRSQRKHSLRFILVLLRTGFTRAFMTRGISASYPGKLSFAFFLAIGRKGFRRYHGRGHFPLPFMIWMVETASSSPASLLEIAAKPVPSRGPRQICRRQVCIKDWLPTCWHGGSPLASSPWHHGPRSRSLFRPSLRNLHISDHRSTAKSLA
jgi:hypothetical protein